MFALASRAGTEAEATLAAEKAQEILLAHKLDMSHVAVGPDPTVERIDETQQGLGGAKTMSTWLGMLLSAVSRTSFCRVVYLRRGSWGLGAGFGLIGRDTDRAVALELLSYLRETIERLTRAYQATGIAVTGDEVRLTGGALRKARAAFAFGVSERICDRLRESHKRTTSTTAEVTALVVRSVGEVAAATKQRYPRLHSRQTKAPEQSVRSHREQGQAVGNGVSLAPQRKVGNGNGAAGYLN